MKINIQFIKELEDLKTIIESIYDFFINVSRKAKLTILCMFIK